jgi:hypothetical protein
MVHSEPVRRHTGRVHRARQCGFTYLWLLMTVAFIGQGMVAGAMIDAVVLKREKERELLAIGRQFIVAIGHYYRDGSGGQGVHRYPPTLEALLEDRRPGSPRRYLRKMFVDPMTGKAQWGTVTEGGRIVGVYSLSTQRPQKQGGFAEDLAFEGARSYRDWRFVYRAGQ